MVQIEKGYKMPEGDGTITLTDYAGRECTLRRAFAAPYPEGQVFEVTPTNNSYAGEPENGDSVLATVLNHHDVAWRGREQGVEIEGHASMATSFKRTIQESVERWARIFDDSILEVVTLKLPTSSKGYWFEAAVAIRNEDIHHMHCNLEMARNLAESEIRQVAAWYEGEVWEIEEPDPDEQSTVYSYLYGDKDLEVWLTFNLYGDTEARDIILKAHDLEA